MSWNVNFYKNESLTSENFNGVNRGLLNRGIHNSDISWGGSAVEGYHISLNGGLVAVFEANGTTTKALLEDNMTIQLGSTLVEGDKVSIGYVNDSSEPVVGLNLSSSQGYNDILGVAVWHIEENNTGRFTSDGLDSYRLPMVGGTNGHSYYSRSEGKYTSVGNPYLADGEYDVTGDGLWGYSDSNALSPFIRVTLSSTPSLDTLSVGFNASFLETSTTNVSKLLAKVCGSTFTSKVPSGFIPLLYVESGVGVLFSDLRDKIGADWDFSYSPVKNDNGTLKFGANELLTASDIGDIDLSQQVLSGVQGIIKSTTVTVPLDSSGDVNVSVTGVKSTTIVFASPQSASMVNAVAFGVYLSEVSNGTLTFKVGTARSGSTVVFDIVTIF